MIKIFRKIRKTLLEENRIKKYLLYALGEIILVVIGILIALQINNANQKNLNREALNGYLNSIAQNIESDLKKAETIKEFWLDLVPRLALSRRRMYPAYYQIRQEVYGDSLTAAYRYSRENIDFMSRAINDAWGVKYLTPNVSGFESLTNSGFLSQLQGTDVEELLFNYYNLLEELTIQESNYNQTLQNSFDDFVSADLEGTYTFFNSATQTWGADLVEKLPRLVDEIAFHPSLTPIYFYPEHLIVKYENLLIMGEALREMILSGEEDYTREIENQLARVFDQYANSPYPTVMQHGYRTQDYSYAVASPNQNQAVNLQYLGAHSTVQFDSVAWAVIYWFVGNGVVDANRVKDFSKFTTLRLRMRGVEGGEQIKVSLKDKSNPTDGSETKVPLNLTNEWKDYEIPLSSFAPIQLEEIFMVASIIVEHQACAIEIESIEYLK